MIRGLSLQVISMSRDGMKRFTEEHVLWFLLQLDSQCFMVLIAMREVGLVGIGR